MTVFGGIVVFTIVWFVVLFMVLPIGATSQHEAGEIEPGTEPGAPVRPRLWYKFQLTTGISVAVFLVVWAVIDFGLIPVR
jgi:predicted secreted protein